MSCPGCKWTILDFCFLARNVDEVLQFLIVHHVLVENWWCATCGQLCRRDLSKFTFRCDRVHVRYDNRRRRRSWCCRYYRSMFTGTWFERSHLSISTICQLNCLWLNVRYPRQSHICSEICVSVHTVIDWSSFCREVCIF